MTHHRRNHQLISYRQLLACAALLLMIIGNAAAQMTGFGYQGKLTESGTPANGQYDFEFKLFDVGTVGGGSMQGSPVPVSNVTVTGGVFYVQLDFGAAVFSGAPRFLEIAVKKVTDSTFTTLGQRQPIAAQPYAIHTLSADVLSDSCSSCVTSNQIQSVQGSQVTGSIAGSQVSGTIPVDSVPTGSTSYIQNSTSQQTGATFNINGTGTANVLNAKTQFRLDDRRVLSSAGTDNLFVGIEAGVFNTTGSTNSFFGANAGQLNTTGGGHSFFGANAGRVNNAFCCNSFFGREAGKSNTTGTSNSFFGDGAGGDNSSGQFNAFFGHNTGQRNNGSSNSFFGEASGNQNTTGIGNAFFGTSAGFGNTTGNSNSIFGAGAGSGNTTGSNITLLGAATSVGANNLSFATAIGAQASVSTSNTVVLGRNIDTVRIPGVVTVAGSIDADSVNVTTPYKIGGNRILSNAGSQNLFAGQGAGSANTGSSNAFFGFNAGFANQSGSNNTAIGVNANVGANLTFATAIGADAFVNTSNTVMLGRNVDTVRVPGVLSAFGSIDADSFNATREYKIAGNRILSNAGSQNLFAGQGAGVANIATGTSNAFFGFNAGLANQFGDENAFFGALAGSANTSNGNSFFGFGAGQENTTGSNNTFIGASTGPVDLATQVSNSIAIGANAKVSTSNTIVLGTTAETTRIPGGVSLGGNTAHALVGNSVAEVFNNGTLTGILTGNVFLSNLNAILSSQVHACIRTTSVGGGFGGEAITRCTTSLSAAKSKTDVQPFTGGLNVINRLKPVLFKWKADGTKDFGLTAEDVAEVEPLLVTRNDKGEVEDVKEGSLTAIFVNAFKEQQKQIEQQQQQIEALKKLVCQSNPDADVCKLK